MMFRKTPIAVAALALFAAPPLGSQTASVTIQAESMALATYATEGTLIRLPSSTSTGTATKTFNGSAGTYNIQVQVVAENDGRPTLELHKGSTRLHTYTYPLSAERTSFTVENVALNPGEVIKLVGRANSGAYARVDKIVLTPVAASASTPYSGTPIALPKSFEASKFDKGGQGVAYKDLTAGNSGGQFRTGEDVDIVGSTDAAGGPYAISSFQAGEWMAYTVNVPTTKTYDIAARVASSMSESVPSFHIEVDGVNVTGPLAVPNTGSVANFQWVGKQGVNLTAGKHVVKVVADSQLFRMNALSVLDPGTGSTGGGSLPNLSACANPSSGYEGFGRNTTGGAGQPVYRVTNLNDSGSGSLRDALSKGNRCIVFDVGGTIALSSNLMVKGANVTIDGLTAPSPGITLKSRTLVMQGSSGAGNVVVRGIRSRGTPSGEDAIRVYNASNIVIDRVSVSGFGDGAVDVTEKARDVTIQWSILGNGNPSHNYSNLIGYNASRVTVHHNLYLNSDDRNPYCGRNGASSLSPETVCDVRNNLIWNYVRGTAVRAYGTANVVNNYYYTTKDTSAARTVYLDTGASAYVSGNVSQNGWNLNGNGNRSTPYAAVAPATTDALTAAKQVVAQAGARGPRFGLDAADKAYIGSISLQ
jgi:pectate lyase